MLGRWGSAGGMVFAFTLVLEEEWCVCWCAAEEQLQEEEEEEEKEEEEEEDVRRCRSRL